MDHRWRKATFSNPTGNCVEVRVAPIGDNVEVRDSKDPNGPILSFTPDEWAAFISGIKNYEFELH